VNSRRNNVYHTDFDLTQYFENVFYAGMYESCPNWQNNGILIKATDESIRTNNLFEVSSRFGLSLSFEYRSNKGVQTGQTFETNAIDKGVSKVNIRTGALHFAQNLISIPGERFGLDINHIYNSHMVRNPIIRNAAGTEVYNGVWKTNYNQFIIPEGTNMQYIDAEGTVHYFVFAGLQNNSRVYVDENGSGCMLYCNSANRNNGRLFDKSHNQLIFTNNRLTQIITHGGAVTTITYQSATSPNIDRITNQVVTATFHYANNILDEIRCAGETVSFSYDGNKRNVLRHIRHHGTGTSTVPPVWQTDIAYTSGVQRRVVSVTDFSGKRIAYNYRSDRPFMVSYITESATLSSITPTATVSGNMNGKILNIRYLSKNRILTIDHKNIHTIHNFNNKGQATAVYESEDTRIDEVLPVGDISYAGGDEMRSVQCVIKHAHTDGLHANILDGGTNITGGAWDRSRAYGAVFTPRDMYNNITGRQVYRLSGNPFEKCFITQDIAASRLQANRMYTLSGFAWANSADTTIDTTRTQQRTFDVTIELRYNNRTESYSAKFDHKNASWQLAATAFRVRAGLSGATVYLRYDHNINYVVFDNIRLQEGFATITRGAFVDRRNRANHFFVEDITRTHWQDSNGTQHSHQMAVKHLDMRRMILDATSDRPQTLRAQNGQHRINNVYNIRFDVGAAQPISILDLEFRNLSFNDIGDVSLTYQNQIAAGFVSRAHNEYTYMPQLIGVFVDGVSSDISPSEMLRSIKRGERRGQDVQFSFPQVQGQSGNHPRISAFGLEEVFQTEVVENIDEASTRTTRTQRMLHDIYGREIRQEDMRGLVTEQTYFEFRPAMSITTALTTVFHRNATNNRIVTQTIYSNDGNRVVAFIDENGNRTNLTHHTANGRVGVLESATTPLGQRTNYNYNGDKTLQNTNATLAPNNQLNQNAFTYRQGFLTGVNHHGTAYNFEYNGLGDITGILRGSQRFLRITHSNPLNPGNDTQTIDALNDAGNTTSTVRSTTDRYGRLLQVQRGRGNNLNTILQNTYQTANNNVSYGSSNLVQTVDNLSSIVYDYSYDMRGDVSRIDYSGASGAVPFAGSSEIRRDALNRINWTERRFSDLSNVADNRLTYNVVYQANHPDNRVVETRIANRFTHRRTFDNLNRITRRNLFTPNTSFGIDETVVYRAGGGGLASRTGDVSRISYALGNHPINTWECEYEGAFSWTDTSRRLFNETDDYEYDANGNVSVYTLGGRRISYTYDGLNRLTREINAVTGRTTHYTYDAAGNVLTRRVVVTASGATEKDLRYSYDGDRLTGFGNEAISGYDLQGRPTNYRGSTLTWDFGRLTRAVRSGATHDYAYNANGIRIRKVSGGTTHNYHLEGNRIVRESRVRTGSGNGAAAGELFFLYGIDGICGFRHRVGNVTRNYYYRKNIFGDVVSLWEDNGNRIANYQYDAYGNCTIHNAQGTIITDPNHVGIINPIRYRGYYWDAELQLYYLNARYYDPQTGRFISQDNIAELQPEELNGLNLFAYCANNPIMNIDPNGNRWWRFALAITAVVAITATVVVLSVVSFGAAAGPLAAVGVVVNKKIITGAIIGAAVGGIVAGTSDIIQQGLETGWDGDQLDMNRVLANTAIGIGIGAAGGAAGGAIAGINSLTGFTARAVQGLAYGSISMLLTAGTYIARYGSGVMDSWQFIASLGVSFGIGFLGGFFAGPNAGLVISLIGAVASASLKEFFTQLISNSQ